MGVRFPLEAFVASRQLRQQLIVGLSGSAVMSALLAVAAVANKAHDETELGPMQKVYCTLSPQATVYVAGDEHSVNPPDVVIPC